MRHLILFILFFQTVICLGQSSKLSDNDYNNSGAIKLTFVSSIDKAIELANYDIEKGLPFLFLQSGISPIVYSSDSIFEKKFKVYYYEQGCIGPDNEMMIAYNQVVFKYLDEKFGRDWRKSIRKDIIGFKKWKRKK